MLIKIDKRSKVPVYRQIVEQIKQMVDEGVLRPGQELPGSRKLAEMLGVSRKTTLTAYQELMAENYIDTVPGGKTFVVDRGALIATQEPFDYDRPEAIDELAERGLFDWRSYQIPTAYFVLPRTLEAALGEAPSDLIELHQNMPDPSLFPFDQIKKIASQMLWKPQEFFFDYGSPQGYQPLVSWLEEHMALEGVNMDPGVNEIIVGAGFTGLFKLCLDLLVRSPDEIVVVENPTYTIALNALIANRIRHVGVPVDREGMRVDLLEKVLRENRGKVAMIYTVPTFHNPTATEMSLERREKLLRLAQEHRVPVVEDNWAYQLRYEGKKLPTLKALDQGGFVIQLNSFSKMLLPGLRLGWMVVPGPIALTAVRLKMTNIKFESYFLQALLHDFILKGYFENHLRRVSRVYDARRRTMLEALSEQLPSGVEFTPTQGGFFTWITLPKKLDGTVLYVLAHQAGVKVGPGVMFTVGHRPSPGVRVAFSRAKEGEIIDGVERLSEAIRRYLASPKKYAGLAKDYYQLRHLGVKGK